MGLEAASAGVTFQTGTIPSFDECVAAGSIGQPDAFTDLFGELCLSDAVAPDEYPVDVAVYDDPLPPVAGGDSTGMLDAGISTEVMVTASSHHNGGGDEDPLQAAMRDLAAPIGPDADPAVLEGLRVMLLENATRIAAMKRRAEANQREIDRIAAGTPALAGPSRLGAVRQRGAAIASMLGVGRIIYDTPAQNLCAAQAAAEELNGLEGADRQSQQERIQELINAANAQ